MTLLPPVFLYTAPLSGSARRGGTRTARGRAGAPPRSPGSPASRVVRSVVAVALPRRVHRTRPRPAGRGPREFAQGGPDQEGRPRVDRQGHARRTRLRADRPPTDRPRPRGCHRRPAPREPTAGEQRAPGARRRRPARGGRPAVRDAGGHRALRPEPRPPGPRPLRTAGPARGRARPGEGCTERGLNRWLDGSFQRGTVGVTEGVAPQKSDTARSHRSTLVGKPVPDGDTSFHAIAVGEVSLDRGAGGGAMGTSTGMTRERIRWPAVVDRAGDRGELRGRRHAAPGHVQARLRGVLPHTPSMYARSCARAPTGSGWTSHMASRTRCTSPRKRTPSASSSPAGWRSTASRSWCSAASAPSPTSTSSATASPPIRGSGAPGGR